ncbi:MAG: quinone-dependent dihydroorotate dehydrogenase [Cyclobacteriaceae bacterium]
MYKLILRPFLFLFKAEKAHYMAFSLAKFIFRLPGSKALTKQLYQQNDKSLSRTVFGLDFPNPVGLAAGFDKNAVLIDEFEHLGFGFIEIGTVTPKAQAGNPQPRLFRLKKDKGIINRMGFNNEGMEEAIEQLKKRKGKVLVGGNIGKNKEVPNEKAKEDYTICFNGLYPYVDYFVVNVSSPNTPNLRDLQEKEPLTDLLMELQRLNGTKEKQKPILLKIAPDLEATQLDDIVEIVETTKIAGLIATNTTVSRKNLVTKWEKVNDIGNGGLSGAPLKERSTEVIRYLHTKSKGTIPIIGVGGIHSAKDALEKLDAGASLVQVYTGFVYEGPSLIKKINKAILAKQKQA